MNQRNFFPGDEWLYFKVYVSTSHADSILCHRILPMTCKLKKASVIDKWFFIRYADPGHHLRVRFHIQSPEASGIIVSRMRKALAPELKSGIVSDLQICTYRREIERYGANTIACCEDLFCADSEMTAKYLRQHDPSDTTARAMAAIARIDAIFAASGQSIDQRFAMISRMADAYHQEFGYGAKCDDLNSLYRKYKDSAFNAIKLSSTSEHYSDLDFSWLQPDRIREALLPSLIHMLVNRIMPTSQRQYELVIYHFMVKLYSRLLHSNGK